MQQFQLGVILSFAVFWLINTVHVMSLVMSHVHQDHSMKVLSGYIGNYIASQNYKISLTGKTAAYG